MTALPSRTDGSPIETGEERFPLFGRLAGAIWFALLALVYVRVAASALAGLASGADALGAWAAAVARLGAALFFAISSWLILIRPPPISRQTRAAPVLTAFLGTYGVWVIAWLPPAHASVVLNVVSAGVSLTGEALIILAICRLGRAFSITPQARRLVTGGPYRLVRHPLYAAEEIAIVGILLQHAWWAALAFLAVHLTLQVRRMLYEESLLRAVFPDYDAYAARTARLIPGVW
jgi:protein-S-isoprenylcysteine O-methyltransferase Ste14